MVDGSWSNQAYWVNRRSWFNESMSQIAMLIHAASEGVNIYNAHAIWTKKSDASSNRNSMKETLS